MFMLGKWTRWRMVQTQLAKSINPPIQVKSNQIKPKSKSNQNTSNQSQRQSQITPNKIKIRRGRKPLRLSIEVDVLTIHATWQVTAKWIVEVWAKFSKSNHDWKANNTQNVFFNKMLRCLGSGLKKSTWKVNLKSKGCTEFGLILTHENLAINFFQTPSQKSFIDNFHGLAWATKAARWLFLPTIFFAGCCLGAEVVSPFNQRINL